jgi:DNA methyltransferase 1-associated protein 1
MEEDGDLSVQTVVSRSDYLRYNVEVDIPTFTDEEYDAFLQNKDWTREETDYLIGLVKDYACRWPVIWDRYDYQPSNKTQSQEAPNGDAAALATLPFNQSDSRTVEDLKSRFYDISAKLMKLRIPEVQMDASQYQLYETMKNFDPNVERHRKGLAAALMNRSLDEVKEEEFLLTELQRITSAANRLNAERDELRARLETPQPNQQNAANITAFQSSAALNQLFTQLFQQDRSKKKASGANGGTRLSIATGDVAGTPTAAQSGQLSAANRRQSMQQPPPQTPIRQLTPQAEYRFNVSTHDRLTSGVSFGSDKLLKMRQAKSNVQTQKIATALATLGISEIISIPTARVGNVFESLVSKVGKLLDVRKVKEKEEGECKVLEAMKAQRGGGGDTANEHDQRADSAATATAAGTPRLKKEATDQSDTPAASSAVNGDDDAEGDEDADGDPDADAEGETERSRQPSEAVSTSTRGGAAGHKRSASVLSQGSSKDPKRARK